jgi:hypothetical protein
VNHLESSSGVLEVGYAADLVAVDRDVLTVEPSALGEAQVISTYVDGTPVHEA